MSGERPGGGTPGAALIGTAGLGRHPSPLESAGDEHSARPARSVPEAAASGSRRDLLLALRDKLWAAFHDERTQPRDLSPLTLRLKEIHAEIEALDLREDSQPDEMADETFDPAMV